MYLSLRYSSWKSGGGIIGALVLGIILSACSSRPRPTVKPSSKPTRPQLDPVLTRPPSFPLPIDQLSLDLEEEESSNSRGLTFKLIEKKNIAMSALSISLKAGQQSEINGAAYLLPSFLLGDAQDPQSPLAQIRLLGGHVQTWHTLDRTHFEIQVLPIHLPNVLKMIAQALINPQWDLEYFQKMKKKHIQLIQQQGQWNASRMALYRLFYYLFPNHPSQRSPYPSAEQLKNLTIENLKNFHQVYYRPQHTFIVAIGPFASDQEAQFRDYFNQWSGDLPFSPPAEIPKVSISNVPQLHIEKIEGQSAYLHFAFPIDDPSPKEVAYFDLLSLIWGGSPSLLEQAARRINLDIQSKRLFSFVPDGSGAFVIEIKVDRSQVAHAWRLMIEQVNSMLHRPFSSRQVEYAKLLFEREMIKGAEHLTNQTRRLSFFLARWPNQNALQQYRNEVYQATPQNLFKTLSKHMQLNRLVSLIRTQYSEEIDPTLWTESLKDQLAQITNQNTPKIQQNEVAQFGDLSLLFQPLNTQGVVTLEATLPLVLRTGSASDLALGQWLAGQMSMELPHEPNFHAEFRSQGIRIWTTVIEQRVDDALAGLIRRIRQPPITSEFLWSSDTLEKARIYAQAQLKLKTKLPLEQLNYLNQRGYLAFKYPPLPHPLHRLSQLKKRSSTELIRFYQKYIQTTPALLTISGDLDFTRLNHSLLAFQMLRKSLPLATATQALKREPKRNDLKTCRRLYLSLDQSQGWIGAWYELKSIKKDELPLLPLIQGLIIQSLEKEFHKDSKWKTLLPSLERSSLIHSHLQTPPLSPLALSFILQVKPNMIHEAQDQIEGALDLLLNAPLGEEDFKNIKTKVITEQTLHLSTSLNRVKWLSQMWFSNWLNQSVPQVDQWLDRIDKATVSEVRSLMKRIIIPKQVIKGALSSQLPQSTPIQKNGQKCKVIIP